MPLHIGHDDRAPTKYRKTFAPLLIFACHPYGDQLTPGVTPDPYSAQFNFGDTFEQSWNRFQNYRTSNGQHYLIPQNKPVWFTEFGFDSVLEGPEYQRIFTERMIAVMAKYPRIQVAFHYQYADDAEGGRGLKTAIMNGARKRVYYPYQSHASLTGLYTPDGYAEWTLDQFIDCFHRVGGRNSVGLPYRNPNAPWYGDKAHNWADGKVQDFNGGLYGTSSSILESPRNVGRAFWVRAGFHQRYLAVGGPYSYLRFPTSDEYTSGAGTRQDFEGGYMLWDSVHGVRDFAY